MKPEHIEYLAKSKSQNAKVFRLLYKSDWVDLPKLARAARSFNISKRISDLRLKFGFKILNRLEVQKDGLKKSFYKLSI